MTKSLLTTPGESRVMELKLCRHCSEWKPLGAYYKHAQMADGHLNVCRECVKRRVRKHRAENDSVREYDRERSNLPHRKKLRAKITAEYDEKHPHRKKAHTAVNNALRDGRLTKGDCHFCGTDQDIEGHHNDYSKPLDVVWLCKRCHRKLHAIVPEPYTDKAA